MYFYLISISYPARYNKQEKFVHLVDGASVFETHVALIIIETVELRLKQSITPPLLLQGQILKVAKDKSIESSNFNPKRKTKFIIHGFIDTPLSNWVKVRFASFVALNNSSILHHMALSSYTVPHYY